MELVNALLIEPGMPPQYILLENSSKCIEGIINGKISKEKPWKDNVVAIFTRRSNKPQQPNRIITKDTNILCPVAQVFGSLLLCAVKDVDGKIEDSALCHMTPKQVAEYVFRFQFPDEISKDEKSGMLNWTIHYRKIIENNNESEE